MIGGKTSHWWEFNMLHISKVVKAVSCIIKIASAHSKNNTLSFKLQSFRASRHDIQNFKNKEEWNSVRLGIEQHKSTLGCSLDFGKT